MLLSVETPVIDVVLYFSSDKVGDGEMLAKSLSNYSGGDG